MSFASLFYNLLFSFSDSIRNRGLATPQDVQRFDNITYGPDKTWNLLDVYRPRPSSDQELHQATRKLPVILIVHGGAWVYGHKNVYQYYSMSLARFGFAVVNFSYRLAPKARFPACLEDVNRVVHFVFDHQETYGFDTNHIFLAGDSAGAHLSALYSCICTNPSYALSYSFAPPPSFVPDALLLNCGVYDIRPLIREKTMQASMQRQLLGDLMGTSQLSEEQLSLLCPVDHIRQTFPACFIMTSDGDFLKDQPNDLLPVLDREHVSYQFQVYRGTEENGPLQHVFHCDVRLEAARRCNEDETGYLKTVLQKKP